MTALYAAVCISLIIAMSASYWVFTLSLRIHELERGAVTKEGLFSTVEDYVTTGFNSRYLNVDRLENILEEIKQRMADAESFKIIDDMLDNKMIENRRQMKEVIQRLQEVESKIEIVDNLKKSLEFIGIK